MSNPFATLSGNLGARAAALAASREADGRNVHFIREDGRADTMSMATIDRADGLRASLQRQGRKVTSL